MGQLSKGVQTLVLVSARNVGVLPAVGLPAR